jgi:hypothetical protein
MHAWKRRSSSPHDLCGRIETPDRCLIGGAGKKFWGGFEKSTIVVQSELGNEPPRGKPRGILQFKSNPSAFIPAASGGVFPRGIKKQSMHIELFGLDPLRTEKLVRIYSTSFKVRL